MKQPPAKRRRTKFEVRITWVIFGVVFLATVLVEQFALPDLGVRLSDDDVGHVVIAAFIGAVAVIITECIIAFRRRRLAARGIIE